MRRVLKIAPVLLAGALVIAGCGGDDDNTSASSTTSSAPANAPKVGLAYDIGGRGDQSFNDAAAAGLDKSKSELGVTDAKELEASPGETDAQKEERLRSLAEAGFNPVIAIGFAYSAALAKVAPDFPDVKFAIVDDANAKGPNIENLTFAEQEGSFLVGAAAALKSQAKHIGFVGGVQVPLIKKFEAGYIAG
ncbi:MAG TPA: BMP family ABC transporter substrate-binding protein, partial [Actinomycetes bacterium]